MGDIIFRHDYDDRACRMIDGWYRARLFCDAEFPARVDRVCEEEVQI